MSAEDKKLVVHGAAWCPDAIRSKLFLDQYQVPYEWHDIDDEQSSEDFVRKTNGGHIAIPTIVFPDGSILVEPSNLELAGKLGLSGWSPE
jgi:glutaredoxin